MLGFALTLNDLRVLVVVFGRLKLTAVVKKRSQIDFIPYFSFAQRVYLFAKSAKRKENGKNLRSVLTMQLF